MNNKQPSPSTLKARRRRIPHFDDEPIQWHRNSTTHDRCPWCGLAEMVYYAKTKRGCGTCHISTDLTQMFPSGKKWFEEKLVGYRSNYDGTPDLDIVRSEEEESYDLATAQRASANKRAKLRIKFGYDILTVYWHRDGHLPEQKDGKPILTAGSPFWYWVLGLTTSEVWEPDDPLNAMEILARAATDDPVFCIMTV
jgi:hypothetical protein